MSVFFWGVRVGLPLTGVRVLDFGRYVAGPYAAQILGFLGAEVIRVEKRGGGEDRAMHPIPGAPGGALFAHTCAGKRSLTLDPGHPDAREILRRLVASADMVVANLPPAGLRALGIDWESLTAIRPDIILVAANAFGFEGEDADRPGFDGVGQAASGAMWFSGEPGQPMKAAAPYVDFSTALLAALGALAALMHRERTGRGQRVEAALARTACAAFGAFLGEEAATGIGRQPTGNRVQTSAPSDLFATRDGHVLIHVVGDGLF
ncbi:MAG: CoA transferase, partial [Thermaurantiacus sp.]